MLGGCEQQVLERGELLEQAGLLECHRRPRRRWAWKVRGENND
jgi:hypothetical protein